jgi:DNA-binding transcriptional LysR family regulator
MDLKWDDLRLFLAVHETGSLSGAARTLRLGQPTLSRRMADLEAQVGEPLFVRSTQGVVLTECGLRLLPSAQRMAELATEANHSLTKHGEGPSGRVRIAAPPGVAQDFLAPFAARLIGLFPNLRLDVLSGLEILNLARGEADLSMRVTPPTDPELICIDKITGPIRVYVARSYAEQLPSPCQLGDLRWISWAAPYEGLRSHQALIEAIPGFAPVFCSDDYNVQRSACEAGVGAMLEARIRHRYACIRDLVELDIDLGPDASGTIHLVCHRRQRNLPKVRAVIEALREEFALARRESPP